MEIYDAILRQQVFLEGLKSGQHLEIDKLTAIVFLRYTTAIQNLKLEQLGDLSKRQVNVLLSAVRTFAVSEYGKYTARFLTFLEEFTKTETSMSALIIKEISDKLVKNIPLREFGKTRAASLWAKVKASVLPANGEDFIKYLDGFGSRLISKIENVIKAGVVNSETTTEVVERLSVKKSGIATRLQADGRNMVSTLIQHTSAIVNDDVQSAFYGLYQWCSVIDNGTSAVCLERNGNTYEYGKGPIPPAHEGCRSRTVPVTEDVKKVRPSFAKWLTTQNSTIQGYALTPGSHPLNLAEYKAKTGLIVI